MSDVTDSPYFGELVRRDFRNWVPITRKGWSPWCERRPSTARLDPARREAAARRGRRAVRLDRPAAGAAAAAVPGVLLAGEVDHSGLVLGEDDLDVVQIRL